MICDTCKHYIQPAVLNQCGDGEEVTTPGYCQDHFDFMDRDKCEDYDEVQNSKDIND